MTNQFMFFCKTLETPVGNIVLVASEEHLVSLSLKTDGVNGCKEFVEGENVVLKIAEKQMFEYFSFKRDKFELPIHFSGTNFQKMVWRALLKIPFGETRSYKQIAVKIGNRGSVRAVGGACGKNPIPIIIPCHRVTRSDGDLGGFTGGVSIKRFLLRQEA